AAAPAGGAIVNLSSSDPTLVNVPSSVTIAEGSTSATFAITSVPSAAGGNAVITAGYLGGSLGAPLAGGPPPSCPSGNGLGGRAGVSLGAALAVAPTDPCQSVNGLGGDAVVTTATVPQFRTGRLRLDLVGDVPGGWMLALGPCATSAAPTAAFISGTGDVMLS